MNFRLKFGKVFQTFQFETTEVVPYLCLPIQTLHLKRFDFCKRLMAIQSVSAISNPVDGDKTEYLQTNLLSLLNKTCIKYTLIVFFLACAYNVALACGSHGFRSIHNILNLVDYTIYAINYRKRLDLHIL